MLIAIVQFEHEDVALRQTFERIPALKVEAERVAVNDNNGTMPCIWVSNADFEEIDEALLADPSIDSILEATEFYEEKFYQLNWNDEVHKRIESYLDTGGVIQNMTATADGWKMRIRFSSRDSFNGFQYHSAASVVDVIDPSEPRVSLTTTQYEALRAAKNHGYYAVPREISSKELAAKLGISHQSLSELLRRGTEKLLDETLPDTDNTRRK